MELLLNLLWLLLALGTLGIFWRAPIHSRKQHGTTRSLFFIAAGIISALLFPTVSATDDMGALRAVMEEANPAKRVVKRQEIPKFPMLDGGDSTPGQLPQVVSLHPHKETCGLVSRYLPAFYEHALAKSIGCRAPPTSY
jgi:hypothetical protein